MNYNNPNKNVIIEKKEKKKDTIGQVDE